MVKYRIFTGYKNVTRSRLGLWLVRRGDTNYSDYTKPGERDTNYTYYTNFSDEKLDRKKPVGLWSGMQMQ